MAKTEAGEGVDIWVRPEGDAWFTAILFVLLGVGLTTLARLQPHAPPLAWPAALALGAVCALPGFLFLVWLCRRVVIATETGVVARGLFRRKETPWVDIGDFYTVPPNRTRDQNEMKLRPNAFVLDRSGRIVAGFRVRAKNADALQARIAERALNAKTRTWQLKGTRVFDDWPRVFGYDTSENRALLRMFGILGTAVACGFGGMAFYNVWKSVVRHEFGWWTIGASLTLLLLGSCHPVLFAASYKILKWRIRPGERFIVDWNGFTFCSPQGFHRVLWQNVTGYGYDAPVQDTPLSPYMSDLPPCRIETASQGAFNFTAALGDFLVFRELVRLRSENAAQTDWPVPSLPTREVLGGEKLRWSGGCEGVGERVFHYRTRTGRALLWMAGLWPSMGFMLVVLAHLGLTQSDGPQVGEWFFAVGTPFLLWCVWRYYAAQIRVGEAGIMQKTPWGETFIAWADLQNVSCSSEDPLGGKVTGADGRVIRWTPGFLAGEEELKSVLQARVPLEPAPFTGETKLNAEVVPRWDVRKPFSKP